MCQPCQYTIICLKTTVDIGTYKISYFHVCNDEFNEQHICKYRSHEANLREKFGLDLKEKRQTLPPDCVLAETSLYIYTDSNCIRFC
jgi:hypothetical protein